MITYLNDRIGFDWNKDRKRYQMISNGSSTCVNSNNSITMFATLLGLNEELLKTMIISSGGNICAFHNNNNIIYMVYFDTMSSIENMKNAVNNHLRRMKNI